MSDRENVLLISVEEARRALGGISRGKMYELCHTANFPIVKIGRRLLVSCAGLEAWIAKQARAGFPAGGNGGK